MRRGDLKNKKIRALLFIVLILVIKDPLLAEGRSAIEKLDPMLRAILARSARVSTPSVKRSPGNANRMDPIDVFIQTDCMGALREQGVVVRTIAGDVVTARLSARSLDRVARIRSVSRIQSAVRCRLLLDKSAPEIGADRIWNGELGIAYRGYGILIGIVDSGIDWRHPDFIDAEGRSRILFLWDQTDDGGEPPAGFDYGSEYTRAQIDQEIGGTGSGIVGGADHSGHGTHVAGIAAGNGKGTGNGRPPGTYTGVAPETELIIVKGGDTIFLSTRIVDGLSYIFQKSESLDSPRPVVVNLSVGGTHLGPHDGTSLFERSIDNLIGWKPGRAVVVPSGNDGDDAIHLMGIFTKVPDTLAVPFLIPGNQQGIEDYASFDLWSEAFTGLSVSVITPSGAAFGPVTGGTAASWQTDEGKVDIDNASAGPDAENGLLESRVRVSDARDDGTITDNLAQGNWELHLTGNPGRLDGWLYDSSIGARLVNGSEPTMRIAEPGNARLVITVGSYVSRIEWPSLWSVPWGPGGLTAGALSVFSSPGPTRDGRQKPEITAPGEYILSSLSREILVSPGDQYITTDSVHHAMKGTSMAAPHVTGTVALMFQADPNLTASDIQAAFILNARKDEYTGSVWNPSWGYGKLNAYEVMQSVTGVARADDTGYPKQFSLYQNFPNPFNGDTEIPYDVPGGSIEGSHAIGIYDMMGRPILLQNHRNARPGRHLVHWDGCDASGGALPSGVYIVRLNSQNSVLSRKMILIR